ncbi:MAG: multiheme c-type cytochrome [Polyangiaceae bacterium]
MPALPQSTWRQFVARHAQLALASTYLVACGENATPVPELSRAELLDPEACRGCHAEYYAEWSASMHASASRDPVFLAMNRRGNEETAGALGNFCVNCHAPMAVLEGQTKNGLDLETLPNSLQGVTCYYCHNVARVRGTHDNALELDSSVPNALRAGISDPAPNPHRAGYSTLLSGSQPESATLCGACHDIQLPSPPGPASVSGSPVALERTFAEWQNTIFAPQHDALNPNGISCAACHMPAPARGATGTVAPSGPNNRRLHDHLFPGVDVALHADGTAADAASDPNAAAVQGFLETTLRVARLCVEYQTDPSDRQRIRVLADLDNVGAGHSWPSGAAQDRRAWVDLRVLVDEQVVYASGEPKAGTDVLAHADADLWLFRDRAQKADGTEARMFWDVAQIQPGTIPGPVTRVIGAPGYDNTHAVREFPLAIDSWIDAPFDPARVRVELRLRVQAIGYDVLDDLVTSGHLDRALRNAMTDRTLLLNRTLARPELIATNPALARFADLSFEWSALTLNSPYFAAASTRNAGTTQYSCAGMNRAP